VIKNAKTLPGETLSEPRAKLAFSADSAPEISGLYRPQVDIIRCSVSRDWLDA
jgi:hypothetical protein